MKFRCAFLRPIQELNIVFFKFVSNVKTFFKTLSGVGNGVFYNVEFTPQVRKCNFISFSPIIIKRKILFNNSDASIDYN